MLHLHVTMLFALGSGHHVQTAAPLETTQMSFQQTSHKKLALG